MTDNLRAAMIAALTSLAASGSTLICCALPALLVTLGSGAVLASIVSSFPQLVWVSENKVLVFGFAGIMLLAAGVLQWRQRHAPCPADPQLAAVCARTRRVSSWVYGLSVLLFAVGGWFAFFAV